MATLLPSIIDMQRHLTSEMETIRQNVHKLEDALTRISSEPKSRGNATPIESSPTPASITADLSWRDSVSQCVTDIRNVDLKLEQYIAHFQVENSQNSLLLHEISSKVDDEHRNEQLRSDMTNQKIQDINTQVDGIYATSHGDHIRIDVLNSNLQDIVSTITTINTSVESISASICELKSISGAFQTAVNDRLSVLESESKSRSSWCDDIMTMWT